MTSVATEAWIGCALLQHDNPHGAFSSKQIKEKVQSEMEQGRLSLPLRPGVLVHASFHNIANNEAQSVRLRLLIRTNDKKRRLYKPGDPVHPSRANAPDINDKNDIPVHYKGLIDWYNDVFLNLDNVAEAAPTDNGGMDNQQSKKTPKRKRSKNQNRIIENRVNELIDHFDSYLKHFESNIKFSGPSVYFHKKVIDQIQDTNNYDNLIADKGFIEDIYATLTSWGMHRMGINGPKMTDFEPFRESVISVKPQLVNLNKFRLESIPEEQLDRVKVNLREVFDQITIMASDSSLVGNSKVMHHLMPDLISPIDRQHTLRFFYGNTNIVQHMEESTFIECFNLFRQIAGKIDWGKLQIGGFNTSIPKIIDNAIMGYVMKQLLKNKKNQNE